MENKYVNNNKENKEKDLLFLNLNTSCEINLIRLLFFALFFIVFLFTILALVLVGIEKRFNISVQMLNILRYTLPLLNIIAIINLSIILAFNINHKYFVSLEGIKIRINKNKFYKIKKKQYEIRNNLKSDCIKLNEIDERIKKEKAINDFIDSVLE